MIDLQSTHLLRRHVANSSHNDARHCAAALCHGFRRSKLFGAAQFRQPEVKNLDQTIAREKDIFGLQIAVNDASQESAASMLMRGKQGFDFLLSRSGSEAQAFARKAGRASGASSRTASRSL